MVMGKMHGSGWRGSSFVATLHDVETLELGQHTVAWFDTPHLPHGWETGYLFERRTSTLRCGDLFTQFGAEHPPLTGGDSRGPSEAARKSVDYYAQAPDTRAMLERLAAARPTTRAWHGGTVALLRSRADAVDGAPA